jgi:hypothetical protein
MSDRDLSVSLELRTVCRKLFHTKYLLDAAHHYCVSLKVRITPVDFSFIVEIIDELLQLAEVHEVPCMLYLVLRGFSYSSAGHELRAFMSQCSI